MRRKIIYGNVIGLRMQTVTDAELRTSSTQLFLSVAVSCVHLGRRFDDHIMIRHEESASRMFQFFAFCYMFCSLRSEDNLAIIKT